MGVTFKTLLRNVNIFFTSDNSDAPNFSEMQWVIGTWPYSKMATQPWSEELVLLYQDGGITFSVTPSMFCWIVCFCLAYFSYWLFILVCVIIFFSREGGGKHEVRQLGRGDLGRSYRRRRHGQIILYGKNVKNMSQMVSISDIPIVLWSVQVFFRGGEKPQWVKLEGSGRVLCWCQRQTG